MSANGTIDHRQLYRLPWTLPDNAISWLEPTSACNLACDGCYRENVASSHKGMDRVREEVDTFLRLRNCDGISIAGGDPLMHPDVVEIVRYVASRGVKPILNTNGGKLTMELLRELKKAGVYGFTFHVDSKQGRPHWKHTTEQELNGLRLQFAEMVARVGGLSCAFNSTVFDDTLSAVPDLVAWAQEHIDIVHVMVFICYRAATPDDGFDYWLGDQRIAMDPLAYAFDAPVSLTNISAPEVVGTIRERFPDFAPCAYLNGTHRPDSFKWLLSLRLGRKGRVYGYAGPRMIELAQTTHHLRTGRYLAYAPPKVLRRGRSMFWLAPFDAGIRQAAGRALRDPRILTNRVHLQSVMIIQPIDLLPDGRQNMCDGCPDMTVYDGNLAWSCRLEECLQFGQFVRTVPKSAAAANAPAAAVSP